MLPTAKFKIGRSRPRVKATTPLSMQHGVMYSLAVAAITAMMVFSATPAFAAVDCPTDTPRSSELWNRFHGFVQTTYMSERGLGKYEEALVYGHALGRAAAAVRQLEDREVAFACLELGVGQIFGGINVLSGGPSHYRDVMQAAMGMRNEEVTRLTGVRDSSPLDHLYATPDSETPQPLEEDTALTAGLPGLEGLEGSIQTPPRGESCSGNPNYVGNPYIVHVPTDMSCPTQWTYGGYIRRNGSKVAKICRMCPSDSVFVSGIGCCRPR